MPAPRLADYWSSAVRIKKLKEENQVNITKRRANLNIQKYTLPHWINLINFIPVFNIKGIAKKIGGIAKKYQPLFIQQRFKQWVEQGNVPIPNILI